jgi:hypothetical protein
MNTFIMASGVITNSISKISIGEAQAELEQTPIDPIEPPTPGGSFELDDSVLAGKADRK